MQNLIDRIPRSAIAVVLGAAIVITPVAVFANQGNDNDNEHGTVKAAVVTSNTVQPSVSIGNKGNLTVKGATVTAVSSSTITATTVWGGNTLTWTVNTNGSTDFLFKGSKKTTSATVVVGDSINFSGVLAGNGLIVTADTVRDNSKEQSAILLKHTFEGTLNAAVGTTSLPTSFSLKIGNANFTVNVPVNTPILNKIWASTNLGTFQAGDTVHVYGSAEATTTNILDAVVVRDATR